MTVSRELARSAIFAVAIAPLLLSACGAGGAPAPSDGGTITADGGGSAPDGGPVPPATGHPRLWLRAQDLPRLRAWAVSANPIYQDGLRRLAEEARADMDAGRVPGQDTGTREWQEYPTEMYAEIFAFMSLVAEEGARADWAQRARTLLMHVIHEAAKGPAAGQPFRDPIFATYDSNRSRWHGEAFALTVDWIYPYLSAQDKATLRTVFLRWSDEIVRGSYHIPRPVGVFNDPALIADRLAVRWSGNNYYTAHMRNLGLMAMALDPADDPDGTLRGYLQNATGAFLYVHDHLLRTDARGGLLPEGFEYSPQTMSYTTQLLLALRTAGEDEPARWGPQVVLAGNSFWDDALSAYLHSLSPAMSANPDVGEVHLPAWYGEGQSYYTPDFVAAFAPIGVHDSYTGNAARLSAIRWILTHTGPGGASGLARRTRNRDAFQHAILYFLLFDPAAPAPTDPRPALPFDFFAPGMGRFLSRTSWTPDAAWLTTFLGWNQIDHQIGEGNQIEYYRKGEWLTKGRAGYGETVDASDSHNTLCLENDRPAHDDPFRMIPWSRGSQWYLVAAGDPQVLSHSFGPGYVHVEGDSTNLYNSSSERSTDILHASRSIVWLKPDHVIVYDRAASKTAGRFKRFWLNFPTEPAIDGNRATVTTASGQRLYVTTLLPAGATLTSDAADAAIVGESASYEPMRFRLQVEAPGGPTSARFLHVLQGADPGASADPVLLVQSRTGTPYAGALVRDRVVLFPVDVGAAFAGVSYTVPASTSAHFITGLSPSTPYGVARQRIGPDEQVTVSPGGSGATSDAGGVLVLSGAGGT
jgi:hypothetical protein